MPPTNPATSRAKTVTTPANTTLPAATTNAPTTRINGMVTGVDNSAKTTNQIILTLALVPAGADCRLAGCSVILIE